MGRHVAVRVLLAPDGRPRLRRRRAAAPERECAAQERRSVASGGCGTVAPDGRVATGIFRAGGQLRVHGVLRGARVLRAQVPEERDAGGRVGERVHVCRASAQSDARHVRGRVLRVIRAA